MSFGGKRALNPNRESEARQTFPLSALWLLKYGHVTLDKSTCDLELGECGVKLQRFRDSGHSTWPVGWAAADIQCRSLVCVLLLALHRS